LTKAKMSRKVERRTKAKMRSLVNVEGTAEVLQIFGRD